MSELPHDEMEHDRQLTEIYRAAARDVPPAALDDAILAAARREVGARPRPAGFAFGRSWRMPLSIAAVLVLSVSLVTLMREEAPELTEPPRAEPPAAALERKPAADAGAGEATGQRGFVPDEERSKSIGLKPPQASSPGLGMRQPDSGEHGAAPRKETMADRREADSTPPSDLAKRRDAPAQVLQQSDSRPAPAAPPASQVARTNAQKDSTTQPSAVAAPARDVADNKQQSAAETVAPGRAERESRFRVAPAPAPVMDRATSEAASAPVADARQAVQSKTAPQATGVMGKLESDAGLPPEKWLERIEELRKQGKVEEAKASLAEFRKRFPNYRLPDGLRDLANP